MPRTNPVSISQIDNGFTGPLSPGVNLSRYTSVAKFTLGEVAWAPDGKKYRYVKFLDAVAYAAGHVCCLASASAWHVSNDVSGGSQLAGTMVVGIALGVAPANYFGWVQIAGLASVLHEGASIAIGDILVADPSNDGAASEADYTAVAHADLKRVGIALAATGDGAAGPVLLEIASAA